MPLQWQVLGLPTSSFPLFSMEWPRTPILETEQHITYILYRVFPSISVFSKLPLRSHLAFELPPGILLSSIRSTWPAYWNFRIPIWMAPSVSPYNKYNSLLYLTRYPPIERIPFSNALIFYSSISSSIVTQDWPHLCFLVCTLIFFISNRIFFWQEWSACWFGLFRCCPLWGLRLRTRNVRLIWSRNHLVSRFVWLAISRFWFSLLRLHHASPGQLLRSYQDIYIIYIGRYLRWFVAYHLEPLASLRLFTQE